MLEISIILLAVFWIILATSRFKIHPLIVLFSASLFVGIGSGAGLLQSLEVFTLGFGGLMGQVGLVIVLGSVFGMLLDKSRAAISIANVLWAGFGKRFPALSTTFLGSVVGVPVFCDAGFILLNPVGQNLARTSGISPLLFSISLAGGLYATHILIPPTPGPMAVAGIFGIGASLGTVLWVGLAVLFPVILVTSLWASRLKFTSKVNSREAAVACEPISLAPTFWSFAVLIIPLALIGIGNLESFFESEFMINSLKIIGNPIIAIALGMGVGFWKLKNPVDGKGLMKYAFEKGISVAGPILVLTGAGAGFGAVLKQMNLEQLVQASGFSSNNGTIWILIAFFLAAFLKTAQGSSTSAMVIAASIFLSLIPEVLMASTTQMALFTAAIGAGAMVVSHANDSYFWIVKEFSDLTVEAALKYYTSLTAIMGCVALLMILILSLILT